jgi:hypothetical protein
LSCIPHISFGRYPPYAVSLVGRIPAILIPTRITIFANRICCVSIAEREVSKDKLLEFLLLSAIKNHAGMPNGYKDNLDLRRKTAWSCVLK